MATDIDIRAVKDDVLTHRTDVLAVKYAQANFGVDLAISSVLVSGGHKPSDIRPKPGGYRFLKRVPGIEAKNVLIMGVVPLYEFRYREIREFARRCLTALAGEAPSVESLSLTLHGAGYGLDEAEAFESEVAGLLDAISARDFPVALRSISFVERNQGRFERLESLLRDLLPSIKPLEPETLGRYLRSEPAESERLRAAGYASDSKPRIFVAMPFRDEMDDVYELAIQGAVREAGFLCERADLSVFTGDVVQWVKDRIRSAEIVVADLTDANPNVYLEVGYAWGCGKPTLLLAKDEGELKFNVRGQKHILYKRIKTLKPALADALIQLKKSLRT
jgi:hypothetical protein